MYKVLKIITAFVFILHIPACFDPGIGEGVPLAEIQDNALFSSGEIFYIPGMRFGSGFKKGVGSLISQADCLNEYRISKINERNDTIFKLTFIENAQHFKDLVYFRGKMSGVITTQAGPIKLTGETKLSNYIKQNSNNVFIMVEIEAELSDYAVERPVMKIEDGDIGGDKEGTLRNLYKKDYSEFVEKCGDVFLSTVTTGGRYIGVIEIHTDSQYKKNQVTLELSGKYIPLQLTVTGGLNVFVETLASKYQMNIHVISRGIPSHEKIVESLSKEHLNADNQLDDAKNDDKLDENPGPNIDVAPLVKSDIKLFLDDVQNFHDKLKEYEKTSWESSAYKARFSSYASTAPEIERGTGSILSQNREDANEQYKDIYNNYMELLEKIEDIKFFPEKYFSDETGVASLIDDFYLKEIDIRNSVVDLENIILQCNNNENMCIKIDFADQPNGLNMVDVFAELEALPVKDAIYPSTCRELQESYAVTEGDNVILYLGNDKNKPWNAFCSSPEEVYSGSEITFSNMPGFLQEYLVIENLSTVESDSMRYNFSYAEYDRMDYVPADNDNESPDEDEVLITRINAKSAYRKLKVAVNSDHLAVESYQSSEVDEVLDDQISIAGNTNSFFGSVRTCSDRNIYIDGDHEIKPGANADLNGTPFILSEKINYSVFPQNILEDNYNFIFSSDRKILNIYLTSDDGSCVRAEHNGDFILEYEK